MITCEGFPHVGCDAEATNDLLGYALCDACADNWRAPPTREDVHTGATITRLMEQLANAHTAMRCARDLMAKGDTSAAALVLDNAMEVRR